MKQIAFRNCLLRFFEDHYDLRRLKEDSEEHHDLKQIDTILYAMDLNQRSIHDQNKCLFDLNDMVARRLLSLYMIGIFNHTHASALIDVPRHKFTLTRSLEDYQMAVKIAALLEGWVKAFYGSPIITSREPSWFMEGTTPFSTTVKKLPVTRGRSSSSFRHGFLNYSDENQIGVTVENHFNQMLQLSITVDCRHPNSSFVWRKYLNDLSEQVFHKTSSYKKVVTVSYPLFAQHFKIFRLMFYKKEAKAILPTIYQRIFSSRTEEVIINNQVIFEPILNWDRVMSEMKR